MNWNLLHHVIDSKNEKQIRQSYPFFLDADNYRVLNRFLKILG